MSQLFQQAQQYAKVGLSILPIRTDGSKAPAIGTWKELETRRANDGELRRWFVDNRRGIGIIAGKVSGQLEILDIESAELLEGWLEKMTERGMSELVKRLVCVRTPSGGAHYYYRCDRIEGNKKLACKTVGDKEETLIETRGEGGYAIAPGSPVECHPTRQPYTLVAGTFAAIPVINQDERQHMLAAAREFDERAEKPKHITPPIAKPPATSLARPGDDFGAHTSWADILQPHGWTLDKVLADKSEQWKRPGAEKHSAVANFKGSDFLHIFSSNAAPFEKDRTYSKFSAYATLNFSGDFSAAAKALREQGYGKLPEPTPINANGVRRSFDIAVSESAVKPDEMLKMLGMITNSDAANGRRLKFYYGDFIRYTPEKGWMIWRGQYWEPDYYGVVQELCKAVAERILDEVPHVGVANAQTLFKLAVNAQSAAGLERTAKCARTEPGLASSLTDYDAAPYLLNCRNGILNLETGELQDHDRNAMCASIVNASYDPQAECPRWEQFLSEVFEGNQDYIDFMQRALGYSISADVSAQTWFFCHGGGANGKSVLLDTVMSILGTYGKQTPTGTLMKQESNAPRNDLARLTSARFVRANETSEGQRLDEELIKQMTNGAAGRLAARFLHHEFFEFSPKFKLWLDGNHKPLIRGIDHGIWRRTILVPFNRTFQPHEQDPYLVSKLLAESDGILRWLVDGFMWWKCAGLEPPAKLLEEQLLYRKEMNPVELFLEEQCRVVKGSGYWIYAVDLHKYYSAWCKEAGHGILGRNHFYRYLSEMGFPLEKLNDYKSSRNMAYIFKWIEMNFHTPNLN